MAIDIQPLPEGRIEQACELFSSVFGHAVSAHQWRWKYLLGPRLGSVNLVAHDTLGTLLGHAGASVFSGYCQKRALPMAQVCDVMVATQARGGFDAASVYPRLMAALQEELRSRFPGVFAYGFAGVRPFRLGERLGLYRQLYQCRTDVWRGDAKWPWLSPWWSLTQADWDTDKLDRLWRERCLTSSGPTVARTSPYLAWRYRDHPAHTYQLWMVKKGFKDVGWLVTRAMSEHEGYLVDALVPPGFLASLAAPRAWARAARGTGQLASALTHWLPSAATTGNLSPFIASEVKTAEHWRSLEDLPTPYFQPGDTDVF